ncbi:MAG: response regulator transcription factor [Nocardioides sp.]
MKSGWSPPPRLLIVSEQDVVAAGVRALLEVHPERVEVLDPPEGSAPAGDPDVVLYDVLHLMTGGNDELEHHLVHSKGVVALGRDLRPELALRAWWLGVDAVVSIGAPAEEILAAVEAVYTGQAHGMRRDDGWLGQAQDLSQREGQVLQLIAHGRSNQQIAEELSLSINSIKTYIRSAYTKIGVTSRAQGVAWSMDHGFGKATDEA